MRPTRDRMLQDQLRTYLLWGEPLPGTEQSFADYYQVSRRQMRRLLRMLVRGGWMRRYTAHGEAHYILDTDNF